VAGAKFVDVFSVGSDASFVRSLALASSVARIVPLRVADALSAHALAVIRTRAQFAVVTVAGEVVAFAIVAGNDFIGVFSRVALAFAADAVAPVVAQSGGGVVRSAPSLQISVKAQILRIALA